MAGNAKKESFGLTLLKLLFSILLLGAVVSGYFLAGAQTLSQRAVAGVHAGLSADLLLEGSSGGK